MMVEEKLFFRVEQNECRRIRLFYYEGCGRLEYGYCAASANTKWCAIFLFLMIGKLGGMIGTGYCFSLIAVAAVVAGHATEQEYIEAHQ